MKVIVQESGGRTLRFMIPTGLVLNRIMALILPGMLEKKGVTLTKEQCVRIVQAIRECRRRHPGWKLAEVQSKDGDYVEVTL